MGKYMRDGGESKEIKEAAIGVYLDPVMFETSTSELTIVKRTGTVETVKPVLTNIFIIVIFFMVLLSLILNQSLVQSVC